MWLLRNPKFPLSFDGNKNDRVIDAVVFIAIDLDTAPPGHASGGLAAASPPVGQPHSTLRRCGGSRPGSGWDRVGPPRSGPRAPRRRCRVMQAGLLGRWGRGDLPGGNKAKAGGMAERGPSSAMSTTRLRSIAGRPPVASQPGHLPGALLLLPDGDSRLAEGFPLRCFQRFARPNVATQRCRLPDNWSTSGSSSPVLSY